MSSYLLGIDVGTTAIKAAVFDTAGREIGAHTEEYSLLTPRAGYVELEAATYATTFAAAIRGVLQEAPVSVGDFAALGLSAQGETFLCLDVDNEPIGRAIVWMDNRATAEAEEIERHFGRPAIHTHAPVRSRWTPSGRPPRSCGSSGTGPRCSNGPPSSHC